MKKEISATKVVFIILAAAACAGFFLGLVPEDHFYQLVAMSFASYFTKTTNVEVQSKNSEDSTLNKSE